MFDIGAPELLIIAVVMIIVVGPKDLPRMLRTFGRTTAKLRAMAGDFRKQFDDALKDADLDDIKSFADDVRSLNPKHAIRRELTSLDKIGRDLDRDVRGAARSNSAAAKTGEPASEEVHVMEPLKGPVADKAKGSADGANDGGRPDTGGGETDGSGSTTADPNVQKAPSGIATADAERTRNDG